MEEDGPTEKEEEWEWYSVCCWVCGCGRCLERDNSTITLRSSHAWNSKDDLRIFGTRHVTVSMILSVCFCSEFTLLILVMTVTCHVFIFSTLYS